MGRILKYTSTEKPPKWVATLAFMIAVSAGCNYAAGSPDPNNGEIIYFLRYPRIGNYELWGYDVTSETKHLFARWECCGNVRTSMSEDGKFLFWTGIDGLRVFEKTRYDAFELKYSVTFDVFNISREFMVAFPKYDNWTGNLYVYYGVKKTYYPPTGKRGPDFYLGVLDIKASEYVLNVVGRTSELPLAYTRDNIIYRSLNLKKGEIILLVRPRGKKAPPQIISVATPGFVNVVKNGTELMVCRYIEQEGCRGYSCSMVLIDRELKSVGLTEQHAVGFVEVGWEITEVQNPSGNGIILVSNFAEPRKGESYCTRKVALLDLDTGEKKVLFEEQNEYKTRLGFDEVIAWVENPLPGAPED